MKNKQANKQLNFMQDMRIGLFQEGGYDAILSLRLQQE